MFFSLAVIVCVAIVTTSVESALGMPMKGVPMWKQVIHKVTYAAAGVAIWLTAMAAVAK